MDERVWEAMKPDSALLSTPLALLLVAELLFGAALLFLAWRMWARRRGAARGLDAAARPSGLESAHEQLRTLHDRLERADLLRARFFANVSHELRTPLSLILGTTESLISAQDGKERGAAIAIRKNALLLYKQVDDLLTLARRDAHELRLRYMTVELTSLVRECAAHFDALAAARGIVLEVTTPLRFDAEVDAGKVERIVLNLLFNAFKFTPPGGRIGCALELDQERQEARLVVTDTGPGVPLEDRQRIFEPYEQCDAPAAHLLGGTGLGLAISLEFAQAHGGAVEVDDAGASGGARFSVRLPLRAPGGIQVLSHDDRSGEIGVRVAQTATAELARLAGVERSAAHSADSRPLQGSAARTPSGGTGTVLVVEDDPDLRAFLRGVLSESYEVLSAGDGEAALQLMREVVPDLVLTDLMMAGTDGRTLLARMRDDRHLERVPVIALTALGSEDSAVQLLQSGAQDYITKPFRLAELRARVEVHLQQKRARDLLSDLADDQRADLSALAAEVTDKSRALERALAEAGVARDLAERAARVKTNFLGMMSHELRTPVAALQLQLRLLEPPVDGAGFRPDPADLERARRCCRRLRDIIDTVLEMARAESGKLPLRVEDVDLLVIGREVIAEFEPQARQRGLSLTLEQADGVPAALTDKHILRLVLVNLVGNAVKYTREGQVRLRIEHDGEHHRVLVSDTGPGIPVEMQEAIFEPFLRLDDVRREEGEGSGLGLAIVRDLTRALGGEVRLVPGAERGSTFEVTLPPEPPPLQRLL